MRPRKKILLFSATDAATPKFVLDTRGMHARVVRSVPEFVRGVADFRPDAVLVFHDGDLENADRACERAALERRIPILAVSRIAHVLDACFASMTLGPKQADMEHIVEGLRILLLNRRAPKPDYSIHQDLIAQAGRSAAAANARLA